MTYHIAALTQQEFLHTTGRPTGDIENAMQATSFGTMKAALQDRGAYSARTNMEALAISILDQDGPIPGYEQYFELFYLNTPAKIACDDAGLRLNYIGTCTEKELPEGVAVIARLPLYLHRDVAANLSR